MAEPVTTAFEGEITTGNSPVVLELATALGNPLRGLLVTNTGPARFNLELSNAGDAYGDILIINPGDQHMVTSPGSEAIAPTIDKIRITRIDADSNFKVIGSISRVDYDKFNRITNKNASLSSAITLNGTTSTTVLVANEDRLNIVFSNPSNQSVWLKQQAASVDDDKKGIFVFARSNYESPPTTTYTGEYSAIVDTGASADVNVTEI